jgi:hypothetical protein
MKSIESHHSEADLDRLIDALHSFIINRAEPTDQANPVDCANVVEKRDGRY